jgi:hypothetical protein
MLMAANEIILFAQRLEATRAARSCDCLESPAGAFIH